jgi:hypothetical protein
MTFPKNKELLPPVFPFFIFFALFYLPPFFRHEDDVGKVTSGIRVDMGVCKGTQMFSRPYGFKTEAVRPRTFAECSKGIVYI